VTDVVEQVEVVVLPGVRKELLEFTLTQQGLVLVVHAAAESLADV
jgi:hypothetical protein